MDEVVEWLIANVKCDRPDKPAVRISTQAQQRRRDDGTEIEDAPTTVFKIKVDEPFAESDHDALTETLTEQVRNWLGANTRSTDDEIQEMEIDVKVA